MFEMEIVLNVEYGGFSFDSEMALWLMENRGWKVLPEKEYDYKRKDYPLTTLFEKGSWIFTPDSDKLEFRSHPDLIACVQNLQELHKDEPYSERYRHKVHDFEVKKIKVNIEIENYHDGKEKICSWVSED